MIVLDALHRAIVIAASVALLIASAILTYSVAVRHFLLVPTDWKDKTKQKAMIEFLNWMLDKGQGMVTQLNYAALPESLVQKQRPVIATIQ